MSRPALWRLAMAALLSLVLPLHAGAESVDVSLRLASGTEIVSQRFPAAGKVLAVWLSDQGGLSAEEHKAASDMAARGVETWFTDWLSPYFLPQLPSSWSQVPGPDMDAWLDAVHQRNPGKRIVLIASGRVSALALRTANDWLARHTDDRARDLAGALLMWPILYHELVPGEEPDYDPVVRHTRLDLVILQPKSSAGYWWRERLKSVLEGAGSRVWLNVLPGLRDRFYRRGDTTPQEISAGARLGDMVLDGIQPLLNKDKP